MCQYYSLVYPGGLHVIIATFFSCICGVHNDLVQSPRDASRTESSQAMGPPDLSDRPSLVCLPNAWQVDGPRNPSIPQAASGGSSDPNSSGPTTPTHPASLPDVAAVLTYSSRANFPPGAQAFCFCRGTGTGIKRAGKLPIRSQPAVTRLPGLHRAQQWASAARNTRWKPFEMNLGGSFLTSP